MTQPSYDLLKQYFSGPVQAPGKNAVDVAKAILLNAEAATGSRNRAVPTKGPSLVGRIFDVLSRTNYAIAGQVKADIQTIKEKAPEGDWSALWDVLNPISGMKESFEGLSGRDKTTFQDVLSETGMSKGPVRAGLGLALDIGLDPLTYIPIAGLSNVARKGAAATANVDRTLAQRSLQGGAEPINPEVFGLPPVDKPQIPAALRAQEDSVSNPLASVAFNPKGFTTGQPPLPIFENRLQLPEINKKADEIPNPTQSGQYTLKLPGFSLKAERTRAAEAAAREVMGMPAAKLVDDAAVGNVAKLAPVPKPVSRDKKVAAAGDDLGLNYKMPDKVDSLNSRRQVELYRKSEQAARAFYKNPNLPANKGRIQQKAYEIYVAAEKAVEARGYSAIIDTGERVRLSDVIARMGGYKAADEAINAFATALKPGTPAWKAVEELRAASVISDTPAVQQILETVGITKNAVEGIKILPDGKMKDFEKFLEGFGKATAKADGLAPGSVKATGDLIKQSIQTMKSPAAVAVELNAKALDDIVANSKARPDVNAALTRGLEKDLGELPKWSVGDNKAVEFFMGRVATWWGQKDLRPISLNAIGSSQATAAARGNALAKLFDNVDPVDAKQVMDVVRGVSPSTRPELAGVTNQVTRMIENLIGRARGGSVVTRSGIQMEQLNKWMRFYGTGVQFARKKLKDETGKEFDFTQGTSWLDSWKVQAVSEDPKVFLFKLQQALEQATREKALFDELGERFGARVPDGEFKYTLRGYPYVDGYYFPKDISEQVPRVIRDWSLPTWQPNNKALQIYDRVLSMWKSGVTIYRPAHHIRNMVGDVYLGFLDGVNSIRPYQLATRVQRHMRMYTTLDDVDQLVELGAVSRNMATPAPNAVLFTNKSGTPFGAAQIGAVAHQKGLLEHTATIEDIVDLGSATGFKPFGGRVQAVARGASELQSHNARLAHFIDKVMKSRGDNLEEIFEQAARRSRKWHPTGLDLTRFEKTTMRRIMPFYSWMRKSTPLMIEGLVMSPAKIVFPPKLFEAIQDSQGIETPGRHDPFPADQLFPDWIKSGGIGPISLPDGFLGGIADQSIPGYSMGGMNLNPFSDFVAQFETPAKTLGTSLTPAAQVPIELITGRKMFTGESIHGIDAAPGSMQKYVGEQIPVWSAAQNITGITPFGTETKKANDEARLQGLFNWLTGLGVQGTGPYIKQGRYELQQPHRVDRRAERQELMKELQRIVGER
jgi:hypothetical protein